MAAKIKDSGTTPFILGANAGWEPLFWFDYFILRVAGSDFRNGLMNGTESYLDPKVVQAMELWADLLDKGYFLDGFSSMDFQTMNSRFVKEDGAIQLMGAWTTRNLMKAGLTPDEDFGVFNFPTITDGLEPAVEGAVEGWSASGAGANTENALAMLKCVSGAKAQEHFAVMTNNPTANKDIPIEVYSEPTRNTVSKFYGMLDAPFHQNLELATHPGVTEIAKREFPRFLTYPDQYMAVLERLEDRRLKVFEQ